MFTIILHCCDQKLCILKQLVKKFPIWCAFGQVYVRLLGSNYVIIL